MLEITVLQLLSNTLSTSSELSSPNHMPKKKNVAYDWRTKINNI